MSNLIAKNKKTGQLHTGLLPTFVGAVCFLLIQFGVVSAEVLNGQATAAIVTVLGVGAMMWRQYFRP